ncbi:MAG TPA: T9SS type A sorting domain-containing protein, partial [Rhodothermales bacterium]|nr:T9SS type A sorting domain-containing protein [Rhodothermales bacterium]
LEPGDTVICTFTNIQPGSLTIIKDAIPADGTDFQFSHTIFDEERRANNAPAGGLPTFTLDDAVPDDSDSFIDRITFEEVEPGTYNILEDVPDEWTLIDIDCGSAPTEPLTDGISVTVGGGEDVVCTFTNSNVDIDLGITKTVDKPTPDFGSNVVFTLVAANNSNVPISDVVVEDPLPNGLTFVAANPSSDYNTQTGRWVIGNMPADSETTLTITARVETLIETTNTATIFSRSTEDPITENNTDSATITPIAADLELEKQRVTFTYNSEDKTYTVGFVITLTNKGPSDATNVEVSDFGEEGLTFVSATPSQGSYDPNFADQTGLWYVGSLASGASATLNVTVIIDEIDAQEGDLINIAEVTASDQVDPDSTPNDGTGDDFSGDVGLRGPIRANNLVTDLALSKTVDNATPAAGTEVTYTLTLLNQSDIPDMGVQVTDLLPDGVTFVSATTSDPDDSFDPATGIWDVDRIIGGESTTLMITVMVTGSGEITNTAEVTASNLPDSDSEPNNSREIEDDMASASISVQVSNAKATDTELDASVPTEFVLGHNYPNPFNPQTTIPYAVPEAAHVTIAIYDLLGRELTVLVNSQRGAGRYEVSWDAQNRPTGIYLVRLQAGSTVKTRRITLMK